MSDLGEILTALKGLSGKSIEAAVATRAAIEVQAALSKTVSAGMSPEGEPWAATKKGGRAYVNAASKLSTRATGNLVIATITGIGKVLGNRGNKRLPQRQMLPDAGAGVPQSVEEAITKAATAIFNEAVR